MRYWFPIATSEQGSAPGVQHWTRPEHLATDQGAYRISRLYFAQSEDFVDHAASVTI